MIFRISQIVVASCIAAVNLGCAWQKTYDLSSTPPFSSYTNKTVALTRDVYLVANLALGKMGGGPSPVESPYTYFFLCEEKDLQAARNLPPEYIRELRLRVGTQVQVGRTRFWASNNGPLWANFQLEGLHTAVTVEPNTEGWPQIVRAGLQSQLRRLENGRQLAPAPWEPPTTPLLRPFRWPDREYLVSSK